MKWYNNGWYEDSFDKGVYVDDKTYCELLERHYNGGGEFDTDESGFPYLREHINTSKETIILAKDELYDTDYKVIKALEKLLLSDTDLHKTRQALRDKINELEQTNNGG